MTIARAELSLLMDAFVPAVAPAEGNLKVSLTATERFTDGNGQGQAKRVHRSTRRLAASATESLDLTALTDPFGTAIAAAEVVAIGIVASADNTDSIAFKVHATNGWAAFLNGTTDSLIVKPGAAVVLWASQDGMYAVDATHKVILVTNSSGSVSCEYELLVLVRIA